jgi:hypothetical protein
MKRLLILIVLATFAYFSYAGRDTQNLPAPQGETAGQAQLGPEASDTQVQGAGVVDRVLGDDNEGSRHQRFLIRLPSGQTILVAHNIDLAPRVSHLQVGDRVEFNGEFQWNEKGGVVHWTHRDPSGRHAAGWLKHDGQMFQ